MVACLKAQEVACFDWYFREISLICAYWPLALLDKDGGRTQRLYRGAPGFNLKG